MNRIRFSCIRTIHKLIKFNITLEIPRRDFVFECTHKQNTTASVLTRGKFPLVSAQIREYAKGRDKPKSGGKKVIEVQDDVLEDAIDPEKYRAALQETLDTLKQQYITSVSLRSAIGAIESIPIEFEGEEYTIQDLAQINRKNPKLVALSFASFPQTIPTVLEAIRNSGLNVNPQQDGTSIYVPIPKVTREHRENLSKNAKMICNKCKENIRAVQSLNLRKLDMKSSELAKDRVNLIRDMIMELARQYSDIAEKMKDDKQKELLKEE